MKIWIDLTNSPHINFFKPFINKWEVDGYEIIITARNLANTIDLIKQNEWNYREIGGHAGKNKIKKVLYFPRRVFLLKKYLKKIKPDIGISHSSFYSPVVGKLLGVPTIYLNDNEHAKGNYLAFRFATLNIIPEFLKSLSQKEQWDKKYKLMFYPGIKEGIYLSQSNIEGKDSLVEQKKHIYIRLEPWTAQYYRGKNNFMDELIIKLKEQFPITILPRGELQSKHYQSKCFEGINVALKPIPLETIYFGCSLFIGAGGSMTRELAYLGVPTLSVYQDTLLEVDKFLVGNKYMYHSTNPTIQEIENIIGVHSSHPTNNKLSPKGIVAFEMINKKVIEYAKN